MPTRDISPTLWTAPGTARVSLGLLLSALSDESIPTDDILNRFSPSSVETVNLLLANNGSPPTGSNAFAIPDTTNSRFIYVRMPFGNTATCKLTWPTYAATSGLFINPNGFYFTTLDPNNMPATLYFTVSANISGVLIAVF